MEIQSNLHAISNFAPSRFIKSPRYGTRYHTILKHKPKLKSAGEIDTTRLSEIK